MNGVLSDLKVIAFTHYAAGPLTAQYIGAFGADVIKIEAPTRDLNRYAVRDHDGRFDGISPYFVTLNRNQRTIALDLKSDIGKEIAHRLVENCDLVIENYRPGVLDRLGFGYEQLKARKPGLIYCSISAYDLFGPSRDAPGQDLIIQALSGITMLTGTSGSNPVPVGTYAIDAYTSMQCVAGILAAVRHRDRTGSGQWVRADMMSSAMHLMAQEASYALNVDPVFTRSSAGVAHVHQAAPYAIYKTSDGAIAMSISPAEKVSILAKKLGIFEQIGEFITQRGLLDHRDELVSALAASVCLYSTEDALKIVSSAGIICAPVRSLQQALEDPAIIASDVVKEAESKYGGHYKVVVEALKLSETPLGFYRPAPSFGEHSREILSELGFDTDEIAKMIEEGIVMES